MKLLLGLFEYEVLPAPEDERGDYNGATDHIAREIYLDPHMSPVEQGQAFLAQLLHIGLYVSAQDLGKLETVRIPSVLETPLTLFIRDNPEILDVLRQAIVHRKPIVRDLEPADAD